MDREEFYQKYAQHLSAQQWSAVTATEGPVLLLAVPGGGKTTVLVLRLGYMTECCSISPDHILTLTYTVAATRDMAARYRQIFGEACSCPEFRTINGICAKIIYHYGRLIGKQAFQLLADEKRIAAVFGEIYRNVHGEYAGEAEIREIRQAVTYVKNMMLDEEEVKRYAKGLSFDLETILGQYNLFLRQQNLMDYDDQMVYALMILKRSPDMLRFFRDTYRYICVDEAQDTSRVQHEIIKLLAKGSDNLFMVGDEDQSIYGFRAAYPDALLQFEGDHAGAKVLLMESNYRSNAKIVNAAANFVEKNLLRHEKHMRPTRPEGAKIRFVQLSGRGAQFTWLAKALEDVRTETAVLYRDNESLLPLADLLERKQIPYRIRSTELSFFSSRVVTDITDIIQFAFDPQNVELFRRIYYKISTFLTKQQMESICRSSAESGKPPLELALEDDPVPLHVKKHIRALRISFRQLKREPAGEALRRIAGEMGYRDYLERSGISDRRLKVLSILARREPDAASFLQRLEDLRRVLEEKEPDPGCPLVLSTIHSSKGLEYDQVYLIDAADGIFPERMPEKGLLRKWMRRAQLGETEMEEIRAYEEERRLFYVGVTRAKDTLTIFRFSDSSSFADEFREYAEDREAESAGVKKGAGNTGAGAAGADGSAVKTGGRKGSRTGAGGSNVRFDEEGYLLFSEELGEGVAVEHVQFGEGAVTALDGGTIAISFGGTERKFNLRILYQKGLLWVI